MLALRRGAQDAELLRLWMARKKWTLGQAAALVSTKVPLASEFKQAFDDDAAAVDFEHLSVQGFAELKEGLLRTLSE